MATFSRLSLFKASSLTLFNFSDLLFHSTKLQSVKVAHPSSPTHRQVPTFFQFPRRTNALKRRLIFISHSQDPLLHALSIVRCTAPSKNPRQGLKLGTLCNGAPLPCPNKTRYATKTPAGRRSIRPVVLSSVAVSAIKHKRKPPRSYQHSRSLFLYFL